jgi:hypothetical protein
VVCDGPMRSGGVGQQETRGLAEGYTAERCEVQGEKVFCSLDGRGRG